MKCGIDLRCTQLQKFHLNPTRMADRYRYYLSIYSLNIGYTILYLYRIWYTHINTRFVGTVQNSNVTDMRHGIEPCVVRSVSDKSGISDIPEQYDSITLTNNRNQQGI